MKHNSSRLKLNISNKLYSNIQIAIEQDFVNSSFFPKPEEDYDFSFHELEFQIDDLVFSRIDLDIYNSIRNRFSCYEQN